MSPSDVRLDTPLSAVVGDKTAEALAESLGLETVGDLLRHYPRRYHVQGELTPIRDLEEGEYATVDVEIVSVSNRRMQQRKGTIQELVVTDGVDRMTLVFFNQHFRVGKDFDKGQHGRFDGKVVGRRRRGASSRSPAGLQLQHPRIATASDEAGHIAVYPASASMSSDRIRKTVGTVLDVLGPVSDPLPKVVRESRGFPDLAESFHLIHRPESEQDWRRAQRRFRFEEAYVLQVVLALRRAAARGLEATPRIARPDGLVTAFDARLPFTLTDGQREVGDVLTAELAREHPMQRLLQGEVGSGKTVVALRAMLTVVDAGGQAALLAPTEVLAQQHLRSITELLGPLAERGMLGGADLGTRVTLLTGSMGAAARRQALLDVVSGDAGIVIGTHALLEERVQFLDLGLVVVDEQHRFGVEQRAALATRASERDRRPPHVLVMTATPIPRTVAMTVFGDLETSTLAELPKGRASIATHVVPTDDPGLMGRVMPRVREEVAAGRQAYIVCARIGGTAGADGDGSAPDEDESEARKPAVAVLDLAPELAAGPLSGLRLEVLHGQLPPETKDDVMRRFSEGAIDVLVATTVVEVGVDVPNATVMVVMDADRFGVSQLHQLRGRIGRGSERSFCLLVTDVQGGPARVRLDAVAATLDGFALSEVDLHQRREGDLLGAAQSGRRKSLRLLSVLEDGDVIADARSAAVSLVDEDPQLLGQPALLADVDALTSDERVDYLERS